MSDYCRKCRYNPKRATGEDSSRFTTLYWDFLDRHHDRFADNARMKFRVKNLGRKSEDELREIRQRADHIRERIKSDERL